MNAAPSTLAQRLADYVLSEDIARIDADVIQRAKRLISYHAGLAFRSIRERQADALQALALAQTLSEQCGSSTIIGQSYKTTIVDAAFANCTLMRAMGLDDVIFPSAIHAGLVTIPVALAVGERQRATGAEMLTAIIAAYEILGKFGRWSWSAEAPRRSTMPFGAFGAVAVAGRLLKLDRDQMARAFCYAAHAAMGLAESDLGPVTHYYSMVCRNGVFGAYAAQAGGWASLTSLEGKFGFLETFFGKAEHDHDALIASLGRDYAVMTSCEKRYPGTALNQVAIEQTRALVKERGLRADAVEAIDIAMPIERKNFDAGHSTGPFPSRGPASSSVAFQVALLLLDGEIRPERNNEFDSPEIMAVVGKAKVKLVSNQSIRYTRIEFRTKDGRRLVVEGDDFKFPTEPPRTVMEREAGGLLPQSKIDRFVEELEALERSKDASSLVQSLAL